MKTILLLLLLTSLRQNLSAQQTATAEKSSEKNLNHFREDTCVHQNTFYSLFVVKAFPAIYPDKTIKLETMSEPSFTETLALLSSGETRNDGKRFKNTCFSCQSRKINKPIVQKSSN